MTKEELIKILGGNNTQHTLLGRVISVSGYTCDVEFDNAPVMLDVRLQSIINDEKKGFVLIPRLQSYVLISPVESLQDIYFVSLTSEIESIITVIDTTSLRVDKDGFLFKSNGEDLLSLLTSLIEAIEKMTVATSTGPSSTPINIQDFMLLKTRFKKLLKDA
jgi:hypothetical protein